MLAIQSDVNINIQFDINKLTSYDEYCRDAIKIIKREYSYLAKDEEAICLAVYALMVADSIYDESKSSYKTWRYSYVKKALQLFIQKMTKNRQRFSSIDELDHKYFLKNSTPDKLIADREIQIGFLQSLDERECFILECRYDGCTFQEIGQELNISKQYVCEIVKNIKEKYTSYVQRN